MNVSDEKSRLASEAWRLMFDYLMATSADRERMLEKRKLTPNDARALWHLDEDTGRPIGTLARDWACDPSNATFIVDRLARLGLAERQEAANDRRVKLVTLTAAGARLKKELMAEYRRPPVQLQLLSQSDLQAIIRILHKLPLLDG